MLVDVVEPNKVIYLDYRFTQTFKNAMRGHQVSISYMDDRAFKGYRFTGVCNLLETGEEYQLAKKRWDKRVISYEAERLIERSKGFYSERQAENALPQDFVLMQLVAQEAAIVKPDRVLRAIQKAHKKP